jgi:hypothetical protein
MSTIAEAWGTSEEVGILCVDFSKAFDSIEHEAIRNCLKFFNMGNVMVGMVMTVLNDRKARIILDGCYSEFVPIQRGTPQGDRSSPFVFILCMEILLIKLSYMNGKGIDMAECIRRLIDRIDIESVTAEAYADDLTIIFQMHARGLNLIIGILEGFEQVTGLSLNKGKTQLMVVGGEGWGVGSEIEGISVVDSITLLGITIDRRLERLNENWLAKIGVMRRLSAYWNSFGLSISGRVSVAKTYILAQPTYLMGVTDGTRGVWSNRC